MKVFTRCTVTEHPRKKSRARHGIAIVDPTNSWAHLSSGDIDKLLSSGIGWVDCRLRSPGVRHVFDAAKRHGLERRGHDWDGEVHPTGGYSVADAKSGAADGYKAAVRAISMGCTRYGCNFELDVWKGLDGRANPHADEYMEAFFDAFRGRAEGCQLEPYYLGYANPEIFYRKSDLDADGHPDNTIPDFLSHGTTECVAMVYGRDKETIRRTLDRARKVWGHLVTGAYAAPGRVDAEGSVVGCEEAWREIGLGGEVQEITWYIGNSAKSNKVQPWQMLLEGHDRHASVAKIVSEIGAPPILS